jgi:hypothetical protein
MTRTRVCGLLFAFACVTGSRSAESQVGGLIKKKVDQAAGTEKGQEQVKFDNVILEITEERVNKLLAAKRAGRQLADVPNGLNAIQAKIAPLDERQAAIYEKHVEDINGWDEKRRDWERCLGDALTALQDQRQAAMPDAQTMQKLMELAQALAAAQAKGDTAEVRRIAAAVERLKAQGTRADSLAAEKQCGGAPAPAGVVKEWLDLKAQLETLAQQRTVAESAIRAEEARVSGMDARQNAMVCERTKMFIEQLRNKQKHVGFSDDELKRLANLEQAIKDLEALCP